MLLRRLLVVALLAAPAVQAAEPAPGSTVAGIVLSCSQGFSRDTQMEQAAREGTPEAARAAIKEMLFYVAREGELEVRVNRMVFVPGTAVSPKEAASGILRNLAANPGRKVLSESSAPITVSGLPAMRGNWEGEAGPQRAGLEFACVADPESATLWMVQVLFTRKGTAQAPPSLDDLRAQAVACLDGLKVAGR